MVCIYILFPSFYLYIYFCIYIIYAYKTCEIAENTNSFNNLDLVNIFLNNAFGCTSQNPTATSTKRKPFYESKCADVKKVKRGE